MEINYIEKCKKTISEIYVTGLRILVKAGVLSFQSSLYISWCQLLLKSSHLTLEVNSTDHNAVGFSLPSLGRFKVWVRRIVILWACVVVQEFGMVSYWWC